MLTNALGALILSVCCVLLTRGENGFCTKEDDSCSSRSKIPEKPNIILLLADDMGYGDLSSYGYPTQEWGAIDTLGVEGIRFSQFYSGDSVCTPARAALLTGRLPIRTGVVGDIRVFHWDHIGGLPSNETTMPEALKALGYRTGMCGKWHLGINAENHYDGTHLPSKHGFDFVGHNLPLSITAQCDETGQFRPEGPDPKMCFLYKGDEIVQQPIKKDEMNAKMLNDFHEFMEDQEDSQPFFYFFSFPHVHTALWAAEPFHGKSRRGIFGDNLNEMAWTIGEMIEKVKERRLEERTLVVFLSDHGPHIEACSHGGDTAGFRGGKSNSYEGGFRVPAIAWWPGVIPHGSSSGAVLSAMDLLPTFVNLAGGKVDQALQYDGIDVTDYLLGLKDEAETDLTEERPIFYYCNKNLMAIRYRNYKIHYFTSPAWFNNDTANPHCPHGIPLKIWYVTLKCPDGNLDPHDPPIVYDLNIDPFERFQLDPTDKEVVEILEKAADKVDEHKRGIKVVPDQIKEVFRKDVEPCCNYPQCRCDFP